MVVTLGLPQGLLGEGEDEDGADMDADEGAAAKGEGRAKASTRRRLVAALVAEIVLCTKEANKKWGREGGEERGGAWGGGRLCVCVGGGGGGHALSWGHAWACSQGSSGLTASLPGP